MDVKLSIIVPVYNVEAYLRRCIDSLLCQDLPDNEYEIILVDDGSLDNCPAICDSYANEHPNIRVIHRKNGGLSAARNSGIKEAKGKYIQFVDSDDYLEPYVLGTLVKKMDEDRLDVLRFNYRNINEQHEVFNPNKTSKPFMDYRDEIYDGLTFLTNKLGFACYAWQFMIRKDLTDTCLFKEGIYFEDTEWAPRLLLASERVTSTDLLVYNYQTRTGSITNSIDKAKKEKLLADRFSILDSMKEQMQLANNTAWFEGIIAQTVLSILGDIVNDFYSSKQHYINRLKSSSVFPLSDFHATTSARRKIRIANISPSLLCTLLYIKSRF